MCSTDRRLLFVASLAPWVRAQFGHDDYQTCLGDEDYATCKTDGFACYKRAGFEYAQCRPMVGTPCIEAGLWDPLKHSSDDWLCPGWEYCAATHGNCGFSRCCKNAVDACMSRRGNYASCLPAYTSETMATIPSSAKHKVATAEARACASYKEQGWECEKILPVAKTCSASWRECTASRCCESDGFTCYGKSDSFARCLQTGLCPDPHAPDAASYSCVIHDKNHKALPPPPPAPKPHPPFAARHPNPPPPAPAFCATGRQECIKSRCCVDDAHTCYQKGEHHAECMPTGKCRDVWPSADEASCEVVEEDTSCTGKGGDCASTGCCLEDSQRCYMKDRFLSRCMHGCVPTGALTGWSCVLHEKVRERTSTEAQVVRMDTPCSAHLSECTDTRCCQDATDVCYEHGPHFAMCLVEGQCREMWDEDVGTCNVREASYECAGKGGECTRSGCCSDDSLTCFVKDKHYARCMRGCASEGDLAGWSCLEHPGPQTLSTNGGAVTSVGWLSTVLVVLLLLSTALAAGVGWRRYRNNRRSADASGSSLGSATPRSGQGRRTRLRDEGPDTMDSLPEGDEDL
jgi:hypothetical protein